MKRDSSVDRELTRRLRAAGCPIPADDRSEPQRDLIIEVARPEMTVAYDVRRGGVEFVFALRIANRSYTRLILQRFEASLPWHGVVLWRGDPRISSPEKTVYKLENGREFPCDEILSYRTGGARMLEPGGGCTEGFLLGYILFERIPFDYIHGSHALIDLCAVDQFGRPHSTDIEMLIDRTATMPPIRPARSQSTLFDGDIPEPLPWRKPGWGPSQLEPKEPPIVRDERMPWPLSDIDVKGISSGRHRIRVPDGPLRP